MQRRGQRPGGEVTKDRLEEPQLQADGREAVVRAPAVVAGDEVGELGHDAESAEHEVGADAKVQREVGLVLREPDAEAVVVVRVTVTLEARASQ